MDLLQHYPTPPELAQKCWDKFNGEIVAVLEPSAGKGDLLQPLVNQRQHYRNFPIDCLEIDMSHHPVLRKLGANVIGLDFLKMSSASQYSHIILNPPFNAGVHHVLKAWDIAWNAEIVAIINAETVRNPHSKERQMLCRLIEEHGDVEYVEHAFVDAERPTGVEIAILHLVKEASGEDIIGKAIDGLAVDREPTMDYVNHQELALPDSAVDNTVATFNAAVVAMRESLRNEARSWHYTALLGRSLAEYSTDVSSTKPVDLAKWVQGEYGKRYKDLKDRAWAGVIRSIDVTSKLSSKAQTRVEAEFENIKRLEVTAENIYGFLLGLVQQQGEIQIDMAMDVFDLISKYHTENTLFYRGWISNDRHRTCGRRIKHTRFIIPGHGGQDWRSSPDWDMVQMMSDLDKVFALLDGKRVPDIPLAEVVQARFLDLKRGHRVESSYFDLRYYQGIGTCHFFPRNRKLVDRLNRLVGQRRRWLPNEKEQASEAFMEQYDKADKFDREVRKEIAKNYHRSWGDPLHGLFWEDRDGDKARNTLADALDTVHERHGLYLGNQVECNDRGQALLSLAA